MAVSLINLFFGAADIVRILTIIADVIKAASWLRALACYSTLGQIVLGTFMIKQILTVKDRWLFLKKAAVAFIGIHFLFPLLMGPVDWWRSSWLVYTSYLICWKRRELTRAYGIGKGWCRERALRSRAALKMLVRHLRQRQLELKKSWREGRLRELVIQYRIPFADKSISDGCPICADDTPSSAMYTFSRPGECHHSLCYECLRMSIISADVKTPTCPMCKAEGGDEQVELTHVHMKEAFYCEPEQVERLGRLQVQRVLESMGDVIFCPTPDCKNACFALEDDRSEVPAAAPAGLQRDTKRQGGGWASYLWGWGSSKVAEAEPPAPQLPLPKSFTCRECRYSYCTKCKEPWTTGNTTHMGLQCRDYAQTRSGILQDPSIAERQGGATDGAKGCPRCGVLIELNQGCEHITCQCGYEFCWKCMQKWTGYSHFDTTTFKCKLPEKAKGEAPAPKAGGGANQCAVM